MLRIKYNKYLVKGWLAEASTCVKLKKERSKPLYSYRIHPIHSVNPIKREKLVYGSFSLSEA